MKELKIMNLELKIEIEINLYLLKKIEKLVGKSLRGLEGNHSKKSKKRCIKKMR